MIPWRLVNSWLGIGVVGTLVAGILLSSPFFFAFSYGAGLGWLNLFSLLWLSKRLNPSSNIRRWYLPLWLMKWCVIAYALYFALKTGLPVLGLVTGFILSLSILALQSFLTLRHVVHSRSC